MSKKSLILKPSKKLILPGDMPTLGKEVGIIDIPATAAVKSGLAYPARRVKGRMLPPTPAGMGVFAKWTVEVMDLKSGKKVPFRCPKSGKMVRKIEGPSHSFTRNFGQFIRGFLQNTDGVNLNVNETLTLDSGASFLARLKSGGIAGNFGAITGLAKIKFGNSAAALATTQFNLQGVLLGPSTEGTVVVTLIVEDSVQTIFTVVGQVTNGTGGVFTVEEMGIFSELTSAPGVINQTTMMLRDLTGPVIVNNGQTIIGTYTFTIAV